MHAFVGLPIEKLTPTRLWASLDLPTKQLAAEALFEDEAAREEATRQIAATLRFRPSAARKLTRERRIDVLARRVKPDHSLASSLLMALHLYRRQKLLACFLDSLEIPHEDGLIDMEHELDTMPAEKLEPAVGELRKQFDGEHVEVYLATLLALDPEVWAGLDAFREVETA